MKFTSPKTHYSIGDTVHVPGIGMCIIRGIRAEYQAAGEPRISYSLRGVWTTAALTMVAGVTCRHSAFDGVLYDIATGLPAWLPEPELRGPATY